MKNKADFGNFLDNLKQKCEIVSTISKYITLNHRGNSFWACCPFHGEKTPSFSVKQDGQFYKCFGCGETGDVIKFVSKYENVDFMSAVGILARQAGMELPSIDGSDEIKKKKQLRDKMLNILKDTTDFYINNWQLKSSEAHKKYVINRGFTKKIMTNFKIGASLDYFALPKFLMEKGYDKQDILTAGVVSLSEDGKLIDCMGTRLIFPIMNGFGDVVGFTGRDITNQKHAKYKNTSQTLLFNKSQLIYGLNNLREIKKANNLTNIILVEGNIDVIACYVAGFENTVACMGTAITASHARDLHRLCDDIILCLDTDSAGKAATYKAIELLKAEGLKIKVVQLIGAKDPDEFIKKFGKDAFKKALDNSVDGIDFILSDIRQKYDLNKNEHKNMYINETLAIIKNLATPTEQQIYLNVVRDQVKLPIEVIKKTFDMPTEKTAADFEKQLAEQPAKSDNSISEAQIFVLASIISKKPFTKNLTEYGGLFTSELKSLYEYIILRKNGNKDYSATSIFNEYDVEKGTILDAVINYQFIGSESQQTIYHNECLTKLKLDSLKSLKEQLMQKLQNAKDDAEKYDLLKQLNNLDMQIKRIK